MNPKPKVVVDKGHGGIHRHHVGIGSEREEDSRKDGEHLHGLIEFVREEGVVGVLERLDGLFLAFKEVPQADIGPDEILVVDGEFARDMGMVTLDERFDDGPLGLECATEIEDITLEYRDLEHHLFFFAREYLHLDKVELFGDVIEFRETRIEEDLENVVEETGRTMLEIEAALALTLFEQIEKA